MTWILSEHFGDRCYWGYCFETLATEDPRRADGEAIHHVDANVEYCSVIKTKLGAHRILMGAEMDCCDSTDEGRRFYVELKTSREVGIFLIRIFLFLLLGDCSLISLPWFYDLTVFHLFPSTVRLSHGGKIWEGEIAQVLGKMRC